MLSHTVIDHTCTHVFRPLLVCLICSYGISPSIYTHALALCNIFGTIVWHLTVHTHALPCVVHSMVSHSKHTHALMLTTLCDRLSAGTLPTPAVWSEVSCCGIMIITIELYLLVDRVLVLIAGSECCLTPPALNCMLHVYSVVPGNGAWQWCLATVPATVPETVFGNGAKYNCLLLRIIN